MSKYNLFLLLIFSMTLFVSCSDDENATDSFNLNISGLEDLGSTAIYEGWLIVNGSAVSTGVFTVNSAGELSQNSFEVSAEDLENATTFVLTIEPSPDPDPAPSDVHVLAGDFTNNSANLLVSHPAALGNDFSTVSGSYILATPTDGADNNENSGIWFLDPTSGSPMAGLDLPTLPPGWAYEGWAVINGTPVSTGTFLSASGADDSAPFSGSMAGPPYPGEDFLLNAPSGLSFPTDLAGGTAVISIEPVPDNSPAPFLLKPLVGAIQQDAADHTLYNMDANLSFPTGSVSR